MSLDLYLSEISKIPVLTAEQEVEISGRIVKGDTHAFTQLVNANLRFVVSVAKQYQNMGITLIDLINEGNLGLIKAAQRFDKTRGFKFISYAVWWIRQSIMQAIAENSRIVRLPGHKIQLKNKINKVSNQLSHEFFRDPTIEELSGIMEMKPVIIEVAMNSLFYSFTSMDAPLGEGNESRSDLMMDEESHSPESELVKSSLQTDIERLLNTLNPRDANILRYYYGLNGYLPKPIEEIGDVFGLTYERVRQIKKKSLAKLKNHQHSNRLLKEYISI
jgi:RNA polymerase primary sigma factor